MENPADQEHEDDEGGGGAGGGFQIEQLQSYLNFAKFALRKRLRLLIATLLVGVCLSVLASIYVPRTFACTTVLMPASSGVLDSRDTPNYLVGASDLILRHANLEAIIRDIGLIEKFSSRRPPLLRLKDRLRQAILGPIPRQIQIASLVGTLETKIDVTAEKGDLTIKVSWSDPLTATELAVAARESFVKARHTSEFSAFEDKMAIIDGHSQKLRDEIGVLADQLKAIRDKKLDEVNALRKEAANTAKAARVAAERAELSQMPVRTSAAVGPDTQLPELKEKLAALNAKLSAAEAERGQRMAAAQAKLDDLKVKLTPMHPEVIALEKEVGVLSQPSSELTLMRAEAKDLEAELKQRQGLAAIGSNLGSAGSARGTSAGESLLPPDVTELLDKDNLDPALTAQLSSTVIRYAALRDELLSTRVELDTAQAAFNHRYQVIVPAEAPTKPEKPKPGVVIGVGLLLSILLALALPLVSELRKGVIVERWQVEHLQLPVLAELRLPPNSPD